MTEKKYKGNEEQQSDIYITDRSVDVCFFNVLPDEIIEFILTYLPPYGDLKCCALVCKRWNDVVNNLIRRSKLNLENGLLDFRLRWDVFTPDKAEVTRTNNTQHVPPAPVIAGRFAHSAVRQENYMYIFGGGSSSDTTFNDLWRFDLTSMCWERPLSMGTYPSPKGSASMVAWRDKLVLFGGWRYPSLHPPYQPWCLFDELHYYDLNEKRWTARGSFFSAPAMAGHSATVHGDRMIVFGGYQIKEDININSNETWVLDLYEQRWWQPLFCGNTRPSARYGQIQVAIDEQHLLVVGGCGGANRLYSDAWLLDMSREVWVWRTIPVRNKKFGALHMWCNPACKVNSYLVVLGPTPNMPQDFQMMRQSRIPVGGGPTGPPPVNARMGVLGQPPPPPAANPLEREPLPPRVSGALNVLRDQPNQRIDNQQNCLGGAGNIGNGINGGANHGPNAQYFVNRREILNRHQQAANNFVQNNNQNNNNSNNNNHSGSNNSNNNVQPRVGRLAELRGASGAAGEPENNDNRPSSSAARSNSNGGEDAEAAHRLQRNLALRCRDNEPLLPKRFDEVYEDPFRMAAFNVPNRSRSFSRDHNERIRRMEEKMNAIRNSRRSEAPAVAAQKEPIREPSPKRVRRNVQSLFVCDLSHVLHATDPYLEWMEYKNYGVVPGAPDRLILSSLIAGNGELILFGGVHKETLSGITHHVSNSVHFLCAPRDIV